MMQYQIGRGLASVAAAVSLLALGVAACGKPATKAAEASQAGPAGPVASPVTASSPSSASSPTPTAGTPPPALLNPRAATCARIEEAAMKLWGPLMEVATAGNDSVKYKIGVQNLLAATDTVAAELGKTSSETNDGELKTAIASMVTDVQKLKQAVLQYAKDQAKLESVLNSGNFNTGSDKLETLCAG